MLEEQNKSIASTQNTIYDYGEMTETLDAAIKNLMKKHMKLNSYTTASKT
ncbi:MAG: hypothetical protein ACLRWM_04340 [Streptococcus sp.]